MYRTEGNEFDIKLNKISYRKKIKFINDYRKSARNINYISKE